MRALFTSIFLMSVSHLAAAEVLGGAAGDWAFYRGDAGGSRYSRLDQINSSNVSELRPAWEIHTGDVSDGSEARPKSEFETTPIVVAGTMFLTTPFNRVLALDPETGREKWNFDPNIDLHARYSEGLVNRGVTFWSDLNGAGSDPRHQRIFLATIDARLFALDASTGHPCADFGNGGQLDLTKGISNIKRRGEYEETSAPAVIDDLVIGGSSIADNDRVDSPDGAVRAFDAKSGKLRWIWHPIAAALAPATCGRPCRWTCSAAWCSCPPAAPVRIITASSGPVTTNGQTRWWRWPRKPASSCGAFNSFITISGLRYGSPAGPRHAAPR
jgi:quinoprotein glucose dehydrogenase